MDKIRHLPSLSALQALVEVVDSGSFTQAAGSLYLTQSAVSRKITLLENHYGVPMFLRNSRGVRLTPEGEQVLATTRNILAQLKTLQDRLAPQNRPFRIRMHVSLAVRWLLPKLSEFYLNHPDVSLSIETVATEVVEPTADSDAWILYLPTPPNDENCLTLFEEELIPVCAPGLGSPAQPLTCMEELAQFSLLHRSADKLDWEKWLVANDGKPLHTYRHIPFNLEELALDAAARGLGVAMTDLTLAAESIERGALMIPFGKPLKTRGVYVLRLQPAAMAHPAFALIMQWLRDDLCTPNRG